MEKMRADKSDKYKELKKNINSKEFDWYFLRYIPAQVNEFKKVKGKSEKAKPTANGKKTVKKGRKKTKKTRKSTNKRPTLLSLFKS